MKSTAIMHYNWKVCTDRHSNKHSDGMTQKTDAAITNWPNYYLKHYSS